MTPTTFQPLSAPQVLDREFFEIRAKLLQIAASFDRLDRGQGDVDDDPRMDQIRSALQVLTRDSPGDRAEQLQLVFSLPYDERWRDTYGVATKK